jgi:hypothetical protein
VGGGPQKLGGRYGKEKNIFPAGNRTTGVQPVTRHYTNCAITTPWDTEMLNKILKAMMLIQKHISKCKIYVKGNGHRHPLDRMTGGPQNQSGNSGEKRNLISVPRIETEFLGQFTIRTQLSLNSA